MLLLALLGAPGFAVGQGLPSEKPSGAASPQSHPQVTPCERPAGSPPEMEADCFGVVKDEVHVVPPHVKPPSLLIPVQPGLAPTTDPVEIIRRVAAHEEENRKKQRNYTYTQNVLEKKLDGKGEVKSVERNGYEVMVIYGEHVERLVSKDDKPLDPKDAAKEDEKLNKLIAERKKESDQQRAKRLESAEKSQEESQSFIREIADAFNLTMLPAEVVDGRPLYVIQGEPKPGYQPHSDDGKYLTKFHGKVWVDQSEYQMVKLDLETIDNISWGWFVARLHKGTHFYVEQTRVNEEVWLPKLLRFNLGVRVALLKDLHYDVTQTYRDYKKFGSQTRIVTIGEVPEHP